MVTEELPESETEDLVEGIDYTIEEGLYVFTRRYLLKRGECCRTGCRNCPYGFDARDEVSPSGDKSR